MNNLTLFREVLCITFGHGFHVNNFASVRQLPIGECTAADKTSGATHADKKVIQGDASRSNLL
jgi:hypothetical protein